MNRNVEWVRPPGKSEDKSPAICPFDVEEIEVGHVALVGASVLRVPHDPDRISVAGKIDLRREVVRQTEAVRKAKLQLNLLALAHGDGRVAAQQLASIGAGETGECACVPLGPDQGVDRRLITELRG